MLECYVSLIKTYLNVNADEEKVVCPIKDNPFTCTHYVFITECGGHTYGLECKQSCGNCSGGVQCDHVTGSCPKGCDAGLYGDKCDLGKVILNFKSTSVMRFRFDEKTVPSKD